VYASWTCATPGKHAALCMATPGSRCDSANCSSEQQQRFTGVVAISGNVGDDVIVVADGMQERVACGPGADRVAADAIDIVNPDCEAVTRA
jgi:hypothetical protein